METLRRIDNSTEKQCKIIFEEENVVIPTCFIVLPYEVRWDHGDQRLWFFPNPLEAFTIQILQMQPHNYPSG